MSLKKSIFISILVFLCTQFLIRFVSKDYFLVTNLDIKTKSNLLEKDIAYKLEAIKGANIWEIDINLLKNELLKDIRIKDVKIKKNIPDTIIIDLEEEEPKYNVLYKQEMYLSNQDGKVYAFIDEETRHDFIILRIDSHEELKDLFIILNKIKNNRLKEIISEIYLKSSNVVILLKDGTKINVNKSVTKEKYSNVLKLYSYLKQENNKIEYIDLRFSDYILK